MSQDSTGQSQEDADFLAAVCGTGAAIVHPAGRSKIDVAMADVRPATGQLVVSDNTRTALRPPFLAW